MRPEGRRRRRDTDYEEKIRVSATWNRAEEKRELRKIVEAVDEYDEADVAEEAYGEGES